MCATAKAKGQPSKGGGSSGKQGFYAMAIDPRLLEILACPEDKGPLLYFPAEGALYNPRLKRRYKVQNDVPVMLVEEAEAVGEPEHQRLLERAQADGIKPTF